MKLLVCGDRDWENESVMYQYLSELSFIQLVHGGARGADKMAGKIAKQLGLHDGNIFEMMADWTKYGKAAGPIRNQAMLDTHPDIERVIAFHNNLAQSKGTFDMVNRALRRNIRVTVVEVGTDGTPRPREEVLRKQVRPLFDA